LKNIIAITITSLFLVGCPSYTGIIKIANDSYMVAKQQATGFPGLGNMRAEIITDAKNYCNDFGKELNITNIKETQPPYIFGNYPRSEIQFTCLQNVTKNSTDPTNERQINITNTMPCKVNSDCKYPNTCRSKSGGGTECRDNSEKLKDDKPTIDTQERSEETRKKQITDSITTQNKKIKTNAKTIKLNKNKQIDNDPLNIRN
jgi:hypothetical protein